MSSSTDSFNNYDNLFVAGKTIGTYRIICELGAGGMGKVLKAFDEKLQRPVAIKILYLNKIASGGLPRFYREMRLLAQLDHPNIVKVYEIVMAGPIPFMVMQYIQGLPLLEYLKQNQADLAAQLTICEKLARALDYVHQQHIIHRDIKPENVMVLASAQPVLMDFGLAKSLASQKKSLTQSNKVLGTALYMAPEQALGQKRKIDVRTDVYGLGALVYHVITGSPPFCGATLIEVLSKVTRRRPVAPRELNPELPKAVEKICLRALEKQRDRRYPNAKAFADDIENYLSGNNVAAIGFYRRLSYYHNLRCILAAIIVLMLILAGYYGYRRYCRWQDSQPKVVNIADQVQQHYQKGNRSSNRVQADIEFSRALELLEKRPLDDRQSHQHWLRLLLSALLDNYYREAARLLPQSPEQSRIYLFRARELLEKLPNNSAIANNWQNKIETLMLRASFLAGDYQSVIQLAQKRQWPGKANLELKTMIAKSHYHCAHPRARALFDDLLKSIPEKSLQRIEVFHYLGMIQLQRHDYRSACNYLTQAVNQMENLPQTYQRRGKIYLYCASALLNDINLQIPIEQLNRIGAYLQKVIATDRNSAIYRETLARYLSQKIQLHSMDNQESIHQARQIVTLISDCLLQAGANVDYYLLRGRAWCHLKNYHQALTDFKAAFAIEPGRLDCLIEMINLSDRYKDTEQIYLEIYRNIERTLTVTPHCFAPEFSELRHQYSQPQRDSRGLPFSAADFDQFYLNLFAHSAEIRRIAETVLLGMRPSEQVLASLYQRNSVAAPERRMVISRLQQRIIELRQQRQRQTMLQQLSRIPAYGKIPAATLKHFHHHQDFLEQILTDHNGRFAQGQSYLLLRFLAARCLAAMPQFAVRRHLWSDYLNNTDVDISTRILVARALKDVGITFFDQGFFHEYTGTAEFLRGLIVECLLPVSHKEICTLRAMMETGTLRVRIMAASRFIERMQMRSRRFDESLAYMINARISSKTHMATPSLLVQGHTSSNPQVRALASLILWNQRLGECYFAQKPGLARQYAPLLLSALQDPSPLVQRAAFANLLWVVDLFKLDSQQLIAVVKDLLHHYSSPLIRYHCLIALPLLGDDQVLQYFQQHASRAERLAIIIGIGKLQDAQKTKNFLRKLIKYLRQGQDKSGMLLYLFCLALEKHSFEVGNKDMLLSLILRIIAPNIIKGLESSDPILRVAVIAGLRHLPEISAEIVPCLRRFCRQEPRLHVRKAALAVLVCHYRKKRCLSELEKLEAAARQKPEIYRQAVICGYRLALQSYLGWQQAYESKLQQDTRQIQLLAIALAKKIAVDPLQRQRGIALLTKLLEIIGNPVNNSPLGNNIYQTSVRILAELYRIDKRHDRALALLASACENYQWQNGITVGWWAELMIEAGRLAEAMKKLEITRSALQPQQCGQVERALAMIYLKQKQYRRAERLLHLQYLALPDDPLALTAIGHYYCSRQDYHQALAAFDQAFHRFRFRAETSLGIARVYAARGNSYKCRRALHTAFKDSLATLTLQDLQRYPELSEYYHDPEIRAAYRK